MKEYTRLLDFAHSEVPEKKQTQAVTVPQFRAPMPQQIPTHSQVSTSATEVVTEEKEHASSEAIMQSISQKLQSTSYGGVVQLEPTNSQDEPGVSPSGKQPLSWHIAPSTPEEKKRANDVTMADDAVAQTTLWDLRFFIAPFQRQLAFIALLIIAGALPLLVTPFFVGHALDTVVMKHNEFLFYQMCLLLFAIFACAGTVHGIAFSRLDRLSGRIQLMITERIYKQLLSLPLTIYQQMTKNGSLTTKLVSIVEGQEKVIQPLFAAVFYCLVLCLYTIALLLTDWRIGLLALSMMPILLVIEGYNYQYVQKIQRNRKLERDGLYTFLHESLQNTVMIKALNATQNSVQQLRRYMTFASRAGSREIDQRSNVQILFSVLLLLLQTILVGVGGYLVFTEKLMPGRLIICLFLLIPLKVLFSRLVVVQQRITEGAAVLQELLPVFRYPQEDSAFVGINPEPVRGHIQMKHVHFRNEGDEEILHDIDLDMPAETTTALVGPGQEDKLALLYLLMSLYQPASGTISIDNHDIQEFARATLRQHYGLLPGQAPLFNGTIEENIIMGLHRTVSFEEIEEAAHYANILPFIRKQPFAFKSEPWQQGLTLSHGERQRLAIARLLLLQPKILLIDEDANEIDALTQQALKRIKHRRTTVVIARHLSTLKAADQVILLDHGHIVARGTHSELMHLYGEYWHSYHYDKEAVV